MKIPADHAWQTRIDRESGTPAIFGTITFDDHRRTFDVVLHPADGTIIFSKIESLTEVVITGIFHKRHRIQRMRSIHDPAVTDLASRPTDREHGRASNEQYYPGLPEDPPAGQPSEKCRESPGESRPRAGRQHQPGLHIKLEDGVLPANIADHHHPFHEDGDEHSRAH